MIGTFFFLLAHIVYCIAFNFGEEVRILSTQFRFYRGFGYFIILLLLGVSSFTLWDKFPNKFLYICYGLVLAFMTIFAFSRYEKTTPSSYNFVVLGAVLFGISDNLLAFLKFNQIQSDLGRLVIMFTYFGAQYFIMHGVLHQSNLQH
jgi:uncharacterized membrane protein YhhN